MTKDLELHETLHELEDESLGEFEGAGESDRFLGGLLGESEDESEDESELVHEFMGESNELAHESHESHELSHEFEDELSHELAHESHETHEASHEGLGEDEFEDELHELHELEGLGEDESGELFFGKIARGIGRFVKKAAPVLAQVAKVAAPMVATAVGGPLGGMIGKAAGGLLGGGGVGDALGGLLGEDEFESLGEDESESEAELELEVGEAAPTHEHEAQAELMAAVAAGAQTELEADGMIGGATVTTLTPGERRALRRVLPHMIRGTVILSRVLRRRRYTRPAVRTVPTIVRRTAKSLVRRMQSGRRVDRRIAARTMAAHTRRVLARPRVCGLAIRRNVRVVRLAPRSSWRRRVVAR